MQLEWIDDVGRVLEVVPVAGECVLGRALARELGGGIDSSVSRRHARVFERDSAHWLEDLGSRNGTLLNGSRIEAASRLAMGDIVELGRLRLRWADASAPAAGTAAWFHGATLAATQPAASERLRLVYELASLVAEGDAQETAKTLHRVVAQCVQPSALAVLLASGDGPVAGDLEPFRACESRLRGEVLRQGNVVREDGLLMVPIDYPEPSGAIALRRDALTAEDVSFVLAVVGLAAQALRRSRRLAGLSLAPASDEILGTSVLLERAKRAVDTVAPHHDVSVLLIGETGTGKELFARRLHQRSGRSGPFVPVNVAAIPAELVESELFGHAKGAFSGALQAREGYFEYAEGGTLFLDEIGDMPIALQAKLLRVLQERRMNRVGESRSRPVDARVVAATNAELQLKIKEGAFREDLYYRIAAQQVAIPPLRERLGDIPLLVEGFLKRFAAGARLSLASETLELLQGYGWPGNVRQLESTLRLAVIHAQAEGSATVSPEHVDERVRGGDDAGDAGFQAGDATLAASLHEAEKQIVLRALDEAQGNKRKAARLLGWSINTLRARLKNYGKVM